MKKIILVYEYWGGRPNPSRQEVVDAAQSIVGQTVEDKFAAIELLEKKFKEVHYRTSHINAGTKSSAIGWNIVLE